MATEYTGEVIPFTEYTGEVIQEEPSALSQIGEGAMKYLVRPANELAGGIVEPIAQIISGTGAKIASDVGGLAAINQEESIRRINQKLQMKGMAPIPQDKTPEEIQSAISGQLSYQPKTQSGQIVSENILAPISGAIESGAEAVTKPLSMGNEIAAAGLKEAALQGLGFAGVKGAPKVGEKIKSANQTKLDALKEQRAFDASGNRILKEGKGIGLVGPISEKARTVAGYANPEYFISVKNTKTATKSLADEVGIKGPLTDDAVMTRVGELSQDYANVGKALGDKVKITPEFKKDVAAMMLDMQNKMTQNPTAYKGFSGVVNDLKTQLSLKEMDSSVLMDSIRKFRETARLAEKRKEIGMIEKESGEASYKLANMYENMIEQKLGDKKALLNKFRDSRKKLSQIHLIDSARMADDLIDMQKLGTIVGKYADIERPVTGSFKTVAEFANKFRDVSRHPSSIKSPAGGRWEIPAALGGITAASMTGNPAAAIAAIPTIARPAIHSAAERGLLQGSTPSYQLGAGRRLSGMLAEPTLRATPFIANQPEEQ